MFTLFLSAILFISIDSIYLYLIRDYFNNQIKRVQGSNITPNWLGIVLTYVFILLGLNYFIISKKRGILDAFLLGLVIYGVYEFTSLALLKSWNVLTTVIDTTWGGIVFALTTFFVYLLQSKWKLKG
jgi:uncharacterized membrane protein